MVLDRENLSSEATVQKSLLSELLKDYLTASGESRHATVGSA